MLSSVVPSFRNEQEVQDELIKRLRQTLNPLDWDYELIFVNDAYVKRWDSHQEKLYRGCTATGASFKRWKAAFHTWSAVTKGIGGKKR